MDEVVVTATRTGSNGGGGFAELASFEYKPIERAFPGSSYNGHSGGMHQYSMPTSTISKNGVNLYFAGNGPVIDIREQIDCFRQAGSGKSRSITIYVDQPLEGTDATWNLTNKDAKVGHTFVKLSMETYDGQKIDRIVGYYPKDGDRINPLVGDHTASGVFKNDNNRSYDVSITISNVSSYNFSQVMHYLERMHTTTYNLNSQNCTDIGWQVAKRAGRTLPDPQATWPKGGGSCPGSFGEALRNYSCSNCTIDRSGGRAYSSNASGGC